MDVTVRNQGNGLSSSTTLRYYRSTDATITTSDRVVPTGGTAGYLSVDGLSPSASVDKSAATPAPSALDTYYYGACVETVTGESDTTNNCSIAATVTVSRTNRPPQLTGDVDDKIVALGESFTVDLSGLFTDPDDDEITSYGFTYRTRGILTGTVHTKTGILSLRAIAVGETIVAVDARDSNGASRASEDLFKVTVTAAETLDEPGAPTALTAAADGQTEIDLSWRPPSDDGGADITGYKIEVSTNGSSWSDLVADTDSTSTSYTHTGLTAVSTRHYRVSAINSEGTGPASGTDSATTEEASNSAPTAVGSIPDQVIIQGTELTVDVSPYFSDPDDDALSYSIWSTQLFNGELVSGSTVTLLLTSIFLCEPKTVEVTARDEGGLEATQEFTLRRLNNPPVASTGPFPGQTIEVGETVRLSMSNWFSDTDRCDGRLMYSAESSDTGKATASASHNIVLVEGKAAGNATITVTAEDGEGLTATLDIQVTVTAAAATKPGKPTSLTATADGQTEIALSWRAPSADGGADITGYRIEVSTNGSNWSNLVADTDSSSTSYSHTGLTAGSTRHYRVSAINSAGTGPASDSDSATTDAATKPGKPTGLTATADSQTEIDLSWSAPSDDGGADITGYRIEVSTNGSSWNNLVADTDSSSTSYSHTGLTAGAHGITGCPPSTPQGRDRRRTRTRPPPNRQRSRILLVP